jgi:hypothetical protein
MQRAFVPLGWFKRKTYIEKVHYGQDIRKFIESPANPISGDSARDTAVTRSGVYAGM